MQTFQQATKQAAKIKLSIHGAAGSGKTYSALALAFGLGHKIGLIDTENSSASLYADKFPAYDVLTLGPPFEPERFIEAIKLAEQARYEVLIIDSLSAEWEGKGGCLDLHNAMTGNSYTNWSKITPRHDRLVDAILQANLHIIACMRAKTAYQLNQDTGGKSKVDKLGLTPTQRDNIEYNFTTCFALNANHLAEAVKDRTGLFTGKSLVIDANTGKQILSWLTTNSAAPRTISDEIYNKLIQLKELSDYIPLLDDKMKIYAEETIQTNGLYHNRPVKIAHLDKLLVALQALANSANDSDAAIALNII